jgi:hypothetical protein
MLAQPGQAASLSPSEKWLDKAEKEFYTLLPKLKISIKGREEA